MMPRIICVSRPGLIPEIIKVLSQAKNKWQTASLVGCQMTIPPDALYRMAAQKKRKKPLSAGSSIAGCLQHLFAQNILERRRNEEKNRFEYRILKQKERELIE